MLAILTAILLTLATQVGAEIKGRFDCDITGIEQTEIVDGKKRLFLNNSTSHLEVFLTLAP